MTTLTCDEMRGFADAMKMYGNGCEGDMLFYRGAFLKAADLINILCDELYKEKGEGKERKSPTPPIERKARGQEKTAAAASARARTCEAVYVGPLWEEVLRYIRRAKIDEDYALWWYGQMDALGWCNPDCMEEPIGNWKSMLRVWWLKRGKDGDAWKRPIEKLPRKYSAAEWCLCAERCSHFDAKLCRCRSGCAVPPEHREHPIAPEECERYHEKEVTK